MIGEFACQNCGACCGPVPVEDHEWRMIRRAVRNMSHDERERLKRQKREPLTCPLRDVEKKCCSVYEARPSICRMQGLYEGLPCPHQPLYAQQKDHNRIVRLIGGKGKIPDVVGILAIDLGWEELMKGLKLTKEEGDQDYSLQELKM